MAEATESLEDLVAEVKAELVSNHNESPFSPESADMSEADDN